MFKKVPMEEESSQSMGGTIAFLALYARIYIFGQEDQLRLLQLSGWVCIKDWSVYYLTCYAPFYIPKAKNGL